MNKRLAHLKPVLEKLYKRYNKPELIKPDPLQFVYRYKRKADMEVAGFLASALAYGRVGQIEKSLEKVFAITGDSPAEFIRDFDKNKRSKFADFRHRFTSGEDIADILELLKQVLWKYGSIENFFIQGYDSGDENIISALSKFCGTLTSMYAESHNGIVSRGVKYLLVSPEEKSACKRLNLFLRWMVRKDNVDAGIWESVSASKLIVPVDVHMGRLCRILGFYDDKTVSLKAAVKITQGFLQIEPQDPVKYDFALSRVGIIENCSGKYRLECEVCDLSGVCKSFVL